jgi:hypothetical protein
MTAWTDEELSRIGHAEELRLASARTDGSLRPYVTMWVVGAGGRGANWGRAARGEPIRVRPRQG